MHDTEGLRRDESEESNTLFETIDLVEQVKSNLESDYLMVQFIYEYSRVKGISYIVMGQRGWA